MIPQQVVVTWLFAAWWLFIAIRDSTNRRSPRYANGFAIFLALTAAGILGWLGFLLLWNVRAWVFVALAAFGITFVAWVLSSLAGRRAR